MTSSLSQRLWLMLNESDAVVLMNADAVVADGFAIVVLVDCELLLPILF